MSEGVVRIEGSGFRVNGVRSIEIEKRAARNRIVYVRIGCSCVQSKEGKYRRFAIL